MKTIHKLVLKSYLGPMILTFFIVMFIFIMNFLWRYIDELLGKGLDALIILELLGYVVIISMPMGIPLALLLAAIMTMGNLGENYELLAMKSSGMSLVQIIKPLIFIIGFIAIGSFFLINDWVPYAQKKFYSTITDIGQQKQTLEFQDGLFFNGIDRMSVRVESQDPTTKLLRGILIYDNRDYSGNMAVTVADSGYIRISDNKRFLVVDLYNGERYEQTRNSQWYNSSSLTHQIFDMQNVTIPMSGFDLQRGDDNRFSSPTTKNIGELQRSLDSLEIIVNTATTRSYEPLLKDQIFPKDNSVLPQPDSMTIDKSNYRDGYIVDSLAQLDMREKNRVLSTARMSAKNSRNMFQYDESTAKSALSMLYRSQVEWHRKISLPFSIVIFFFIGAPIGAIIRKGGLGTPIIIAIVFFVIYYVISLSGEKFAKEGNWIALYGMWLSTFILAPTAMFLTYKATRDSSLLDTDLYMEKLKWFKDRVIMKIKKIKKNESK